MANRYLRNSANGRRGWPLPVNSFERLDFRRRSLQARMRGIIFSIVPILKPDIWATKHGFLANRCVLRNQRRYGNFSANGCRNVAQMIRKTRFAIYNDVTGRERTAVLSRGTLNRGAARRVPLSGFKCNHCHLCDTRGFTGALGDESK